MMKKVYIVLFAILYICVAVISTAHAFEFFGLANGSTMAMVLAGAFEIGQAAVLFSLLTSTKDRSKVMPWVLMCILTLVQILGNVYSSYKYILMNSMDNLKYFKDPIFVWTNLPDDQANVIVTYLVGAILPLVSLLLTSMVVNQLDVDENKEDQNKEQKEQEKEQEIEKDIDDKIEKEIEKSEQNLIDSQQALPESVSEIEKNEKDAEISKDIEDVFDDPIVPEITYTKPKSHFVNI